MYERSFGDGERDTRPIYVSSVRRDGALREDWKQAAEYVAHVENTIALPGEGPQDEPLPPGEDSVHPGFIMVGRRKGLTAIAETAAGIIEHGRAFKAWADLVGDDLEALLRFDEVFLGSWESVAEFAGELVGRAEPLAPGASAEEQAAQAQLLARELADELQRRGLIRTAVNPQGGVWLFRGPEQGPSRDGTGADGGGEDA